MKKINLRELYPDVYTTDFLVDVTEEVMEAIRAAERAEANNRIISEKMATKNARFPRWKTGAPRTAIIILNHT